MGKLLWGLKPCPCPWACWVGWGSKVARPAVLAAFQPVGCAPEVLSAPLPSPSQSSAFSFSFLYVSAFQNCHPLTVEYSSKGRSLNPLVAIRNVLTKAASVADGEATKLRSLSEGRAWTVLWSKDTFKLTASLVLNYVYKEICYYLSPNSV